MFAIDICPEVATFVPAMIVAQQKRKENMVEYLLYMWQVEDLIRANGLDIDKIRETLIEQYDQPATVKAEIVRWYEELIDMMRNEGVTERGHLQINRNVILSLTELHQSLLTEPRETTYGALYYKTLPSIVQLRAKAGGAEMPEIETCFTALYGYLLLRMQGRPVSAETQEAMKQIHTFLSFLAAKYKESETVS